MRTLILASLLTFTFSLGAQTPDTPIGFIPEAIAFKDAPPTLPPGSKMSLLEGSPGAEGMFTMRVRIPAGSAIPPHWHPRQERVTVLAGAVDLGFGSVANKNDVTRYRAGSFYLNPPRMMHYLFFPENTELQITGSGPWESMTTDPNEKPAAAEGATVKVRDITPTPGSELTPTTTIKATVDFDIKNFRHDTYFLDFVFESRVPNRTIGVAPTVIPYRKGTTQTHFVESATGTITLIQDLGRFVDLPDLKHPVRMRVYVHEKRSETSNHVVGMSDWIAFH